MASSMDRMARFSSYAFPEAPPPVDAATAAVNRTLAAVRSGTSVPIPPGAKEALRDAFVGLSGADAERVADIIAPILFRFWRCGEADNPELTQTLRNRGACAVSRLDGIDWEDPAKVSQAFTKSAAAVQPNMIVVDLGIATETGVSREP